MIWVLATLFLLDMVLIAGFVAFWLQCKRWMQQPPASVLGPSVSEQAAQQALEALRSQFQGELLRLKRICEEADKVLERARNRVVVYPVSEEEKELSQIGKAATDSFQNSIFSAPSQFPPSERLKTLLG